MSPRVRFLIAVITLAATVSLAATAGAQEPACPEEAPADESSPFDFSEPLDDLYEDLGETAAETPPPYSSERIGRYWLFSLFSSAPGFVQRVKFESQYAHSSVNTPIPPGMGAVFQPIQILKAGVAWEGRYASLRLEDSAVTLAFASTPGRREFDLHVAPLTTPSIAVALRPTPTFPLKLEGHVDTHLGYGRYDTGEEGSDSDKPFYSFASAQAGVHLAWEVWQKYFLGQPRAEVKAGAQWFGISGSMPSDETFPGLDYESSGVLFGARLNVIAPPFAFTFRSTCKDHRGRLRRCRGTHPSAFVFGAGYYVGPEGQYIVLWHLDWRLGNRF